ncbi:MAG: hypothetical protein FWF59_07805 [Turicibacter sp.]|nr:hypothetical protein [Turicibacter sp.]
MGTIIKFKCRESSKAAPTLTSAGSGTLVDDLDAALETYYNEQGDKEEPDYFWEDLDLKDYRGVNAKKPPKKS